MQFDNILKQFKELSERRSFLLKVIKDTDNDIVSISERLDELRHHRDAEGVRDEIAKARDKRKRLRSDISDVEHKVRLIEIDIAALKMRFKWLVDYEVRDEQK